MSDKTKKDFEVLFKTYYEELFIRAVSMIGDEEEACDVVHEAFARLWKRYHSVAESSCRAFLYATVSNLCVDWLRRHEVAGRYEEWVMRETAEYDNSVNEERLHFIETEIRAFPSLTRKIIEACFFRQSTYRKAAEQLGVSESTIKYHVHKVVEELRNKVKEKGL